MNRRALIKAGAKVLPALATLGIATVAVSGPTLAAWDCFGNCKAACADYCVESCKGDCMGDCKGSCGDCGGTCSGANAS